MSEKVVAVAGATGAVGTEMLRVLEKRSFPVKELRALASARSKGKRLKFRGEDVTVEVLSHGSFEGAEIALFSAGAARSKEFAQSAVQAGCVVVDNSSAFRMDPKVPLVIPEINARRVKEHKGIVANPNCTTIVALVAVWPIHQKAGVRRMVVASYQAASGAGARAMAELESQTRDVLEGREAKPEAFPHPIAFNLFPHVGEFGPDGYCTEETKLIDETQKIFEDPDILVTGTTVRVPVFRAHSEAINLELASALSPEEAREILRKAPGVKVVDEPDQARYPTPLQAAGEDDVLVGRIRRDPTVEHGLNIWVSGDQLLKGAALNAVQIAELLGPTDLQRGLD